MSSTAPRKLWEQARVQHLALDHSEAAGLTLAFRLHSLDGNRIHAVSFANVRGLRFLGESTELWSRIVVLMAEDISSSQWAGVRFRVTESEGEFISFYCASIDERVD